MHGNTSSKFLLKLHQFLSFFIHNACVRHCGNASPLATQGCQVAYLHTKNPNFGPFWSAFKWKILVYFMVTADWYILMLFVKVCGYWHIFTRFAMFYVLR
jgi:hypothetical protein